MSPVLQQSGGFRGDVPLVGVGQCPPGINVLANLIDDGSQVVLLLLGGKLMPFIKHHFILLYSLGAFFWLGDGGDKLGTPALIHNALGGLAVRVQLPMPLWIVVGGIENGVVEEGIGHGGLGFGRYGDALGHARNIQQIKMQMND